MPGNSRRRTPRARRSQWPPCRLAPASKLILSPRLDRKPREKGSVVMKYQFHIVDVFTSSAFGGNQLAVVPEASGLSTEGMQKITREFNFAESTFVLPPANSRNTRQVRIFTPGGEVPFAGHPNVGTACALIMRGHIGGEGSQSLIFEEGIGPVSVNVE